MGGLPLGTHEESIFFGAIFACPGATMKGQMVRWSDGQTVLIWRVGTPYNFETALHVEIPILVGWNSFSFRDD